MSFAETNCGAAGEAKAQSDCHGGGGNYCDVIQYLDTNWIYPTASPTWSSFSTQSASSWYQHVPGSSTTRIQSQGYGGGYLVNQANPQAQSYFRSYVQSNYGSADGLMMDDQTTTGAGELYYSTCGCLSSNEVSDNQALITDHGQMSAAMTHSNGSTYLQIDNSLTSNPNQNPGIDLLSSSDGVHGLIAEGQPMSNGTLDPNYSTLLDEIAQVDTTTNNFVVPLSYAPQGASYQTQSRLVQESTMLLGYSPGHLVDWARLEEGSNDLNIWPEEGIYPTQPLESMSAPSGNGCLAGTGQVCASGGHNSLQVAPGVYRREFGDCHDQGTDIGACASIINTTSSPVTIQARWLQDTYHHQITFNGGDEQSGGNLNTTGSPFTPNTTTIPAKDATLLAQ